MKQKSSIPTMWSPWKIVLRTESPPEIWVWRFRSIQAIAWHKGSMWVIQGVSWDVQHVGVRVIQGVSWDVQHVGGRVRGGGTPIFEHGGELLLYCDIFRSYWVPFLCPTRSSWPPLRAEQIGLSLSHLVPEKIWPKVCLFCFTKIYHLTLLKQFIPIFSLIFNLVDHLFHCY